MFVAALANIDPDLLRSFVLIAEGRSFTRAAALVGRTQSAVSMQIRRLEEILGQPVLHRSPHGIELTPHGVYLLGRARELLKLNDEIVATFRAPQVAGRVRLGSPDDYALRWLPPVLARFAETHPDVEVEVVCLPSADLAELIKAGKLDLSLISEGQEPARIPSKLLWRGPLVWVTSERASPHRLTPLPLATAHDHCTWRDAAVAALEHARMPYRLAYIAGTQIGTVAPVLAGLAVTISTLAWLPEGLRPVRPDEGLPPLPEFGIMLVKTPGARQPITDALAEHIERSFETEQVRDAPALAG